MINGAEHLLKQLEQKVTLTLDRCGLMYRIFSRVKTEVSLKNKLQSKGQSYYNDKKKIQDLFGLRITLYFSDDVDLLHNYLKQRNEYIDESADAFGIDKFCPKRLNVIMRIPEEMRELFYDIVHDSDNKDIIDDTYEIQIRTVLSEGWHEVEHDLRYKCKEDWNDFDQYSRLLNGIYATLETSEWSMLSLFDNLSHDHYKKKNWDAMMRNKMRVKFNIKNGATFSSEMNDYLTQHEDLVRLLFKTSRNEALNWILTSKFNLPLTYDTVLFVLNRIGPNDEELIGKEPTLLSKEFESLNKCM